MPTISSIIGHLPSWKKVASSTRSTPGRQNNKGAHDVRKNQASGHHKRQLRTLEQILRSAFRHENLKISSTRKRGGHRRWIRWNEYHPAKAGSSSGSRTFRARS